MLIKNEEPEHQEQEVKQNRQERERVEVLVGEGVIRCLGKPPGLHRVQVRQLWPGRYRVNVFVGPNATSVTLAHSFFLEADGSGNILGSTPAITQRY